MPATKPNSQWPKIDDPSFHEISNKIESKGLQARCREPRQGGAERPIALQDGAGAMSGYRRKCSNGVVRENENLFDDGDGVREVHKIGHVALTRTTWEFGVEECRETQHSQYA